MRYKSLYAFEVVDYIRKGCNVWMLDRDCGEVAELTEMPLQEFFDVIDTATEDKQNRFAFWIDEKE